MSLVFLTQHEGILGPIAKVLGWILNILAEFLNLFDIQNTGLTIILFTFIAYTLMLPLTLKQSKFQKLQTTMAPELSAIQRKYKGKKDEASMRKQQEETSAVYRKFGTSPTAGCLPMLVQLPLMFALYRVIYHLPGYVDIFQDTYEGLANQLTGVKGIGTSIQDLIDTSTIKLNQGLKIPATEWQRYLETGVQADTTNVVNNLIDVLSQLKTTGWEALRQIKGVADNASIMQAINDTQAASSSINSFLGLSVVETPNLMSPAVIIPILAAGSQFLQTKLMPQTNTDPDAPGASAFKSMNMIMPIMSGVFCIILPIGVGLYWIAGSVYRIVQQILVNAYMKKLDVEELIKKNLDKQNKKRARRGEKPVSYEEITKQRTSAINASVADKTIVNKKKGEPSDYKRSDVSYKAGSISANANLLARKNGEKGDK